MFVHLTATTQTGELKTWKGFEELADQVLASWKRKGHTNITDRRISLEVPTRVATPAPVAKAPVASTGRVGKGKAVHKITAGHANCGVSFRRNSLINGSRGREVSLTGETVTCRNCH